MRKMRGVKRIYKISNNCVKVSELMRRERGSMDCSDCSLLVQEVKRRGELVRRTFLIFLSTFWIWKFVHIIISKGEGHGGQDPEAGSKTSKHNWIVTLICL